MKRKHRIIYFAILATVLLTALAMTVLTLRNGNICADVELDPLVAYCTNYLLVIVSIFATYSTIRYKSIWSAILRMSIIGAVALADVIYYFLFQDKNVLWCLPVLAVAYATVWFKEKSEE